MITFDQRMGSGNRQDWNLTITNGSGIKRALISATALTAWAWADRWAAEVTRERGEYWHLLSVRPRHTCRPGCEHAGTGHSESGFAANH